MEQAVFQDLNPVQMQLPGAALELQQQQCWQSSPGEGLALPLPAEEDLAQPQNCGILFLNAPLTIPRSGELRDQFTANYEEI